MAFVAGTHWVWEITNMLLRGSAEYHPTVKEAQMLEMTGTSSAENLSSPRVFNTHLMFRHLPKDFIERLSVDNVFVFNIYVYQSLKRNQSSKH